jgi:hypothetical protein
MYESGQIDQVASGIWDRFAFEQVHPANDLSDVRKA